MGKRTSAKGGRTASKKGKDIPIEEEEEITPKRAFFIGLFILSLILCPILGAGLYLVRIQQYIKFEYAGGPVLMGAGIGLGLAALLSFLLMKRSFREPYAEY